jgi:Xaa-Pro aminopeptidase
MDVRTVFQREYKDRMAIFDFLVKKILANHILMPNREIVSDEFIVMDFFPHLKTFGYYANVSSTFIKGKLTEKQANLYNTVKAAYDMVIDMRYGEIQMKDIMARTFEYFESKGYKSSNTSNPLGMFHSVDILLISTFTNHKNRTSR